jgi:predicted ATPase/DNA-binding CsgD family transcriptional regulator
MCYTKIADSLLPTSWIDWICCVFFAGLDDNTTMAQSDQHAVSHNLPAQLTRFVGRAEELSELARLLVTPDIRLITILGMGGIGKTRLAIELASAHLSDFDRVCFVSLAPYQLPKDVLVGIATALIPRMYGGGSTFQQILDALDGVRTLVVLDNCEHLLAGFSEVGELLAAAPDLKILATSREKLDLRGEMAFAISGLDLTESTSLDEAAHNNAVKLFVQSARYIQPKYKLDAEHLNAVNRICHLVQGMPLGIELATAWIDTLSPEEIAGEIEANLDFLTSQHRDTPERQRSIRAVLDYSWNQLAEAEQHCYMKLSIFWGGFTRDAAKRVAGTDLQVLRRFVDKSLLTRDSAGRYNLHELLRQFAREQLATIYATNIVAESHADYFAEFMQLREAEIKGETQLAALDAIQADYENVRAAWTWAVENANYPVIDHMIESLYWYGYTRYTAQPLYRYALTQLDPGTEETPLRTWAHLIARSWTFIDSKQARLEEALKIARHYDDPLVKAVSAQTLGWLAFDLDHNYQKAIAFYEESLVLYREQDNAFGEADILTQLGQCRARLWDMDTALTFFQQALALSRKIGDRIRIAASLSLIGENCFINGSYARAEAHFEEATAVTRDLMSWWSICWNIAHLGLIAILNGDLERAKTFAEESQILSAEFDKPHDRKPARILAGLVATLDENYLSGWEYCQAVEATENAYGFAITIVGNIGLAMAACGLQEYRLARAQMQQALRNAPFSVALKIWCVPISAIILWQLGENERAAELVGLALKHPASAHGWMEKWPLFKGFLTDLEAAQGRISYTAALTRGKTLDLDKTVADLLDLFSNVAETEELAALSGPLPSTPGQVIKQNLVEPLSDRELEVLRLVTTGLSNKEIADRLVVDVGTVKKHLTHIYGKLGVASRTQAILLAQKLSLI